MKRIILLILAMCCLYGCQPSHVHLPTKFRGGQMYSVGYDRSEIKFAGDPKRGHEDLRLRSITDGPAKVRVGRHYNETGKNFLYTYTIENNKVIDLVVTEEDD